MKLPRTLVLVKRSSFDNYFGAGSKLKSQLTAAAIKRYKITHDIHYQSLKHIEQVLDQRGVPYHCHYRGKLDDYSPYDLIITVGGDGTFLEASHYVVKQHVIGVNSDPQWSVGRFCVANANTFADCLSRFLLGQSKTQYLSRLQFKLSTSPKVYRVLNDVLVCHQNPAAMSRYYIKLNDKYEDQRSSGVWVSTPAGSTGAIKSAGGKTLPVLSQLLQYKPRELYHGFKFKYQLKGGLIKVHDELSITSLMREGVVYVDGSHICLPFGLGVKITFSLSKYPLKTVWK